MRRANVLFLLGDQHHARCLSCAGHPDVRTPNLDQIAECGIRFTNAYTNSPDCGASRLSLLSSLYPSTHGYYGQHQFPSHGILSHFKQHGYRTAAIGRLHADRRSYANRCCFVYDEASEYVEHLKAVGLSEGRGSGSASSIPLGHSSASVIARQVIHFLRSEAGNVPWFVWASFSDPARSSPAAEPFDSMYNPAALRLPPTREHEKEATRNARLQIPEEQLRKRLSTYFGLIGQVDYAVGLILSELRRLGQIETTIITYTSDHGDFAGEHGLMAKDACISYRAVTQIPLIVSLPGEESSDGSSEALAESVDLYPTLCDLVELDPPGLVQGRSLAGIIRGRQLSIRTSALTESPRRKALATDKRRYVANRHSQETDELYDLSDDPWELRNIIDQPGSARVAKAVLRELLKRLIEARQPLTTE